MTPIPLYNTEVQNAPTEVRAPDLGATDEPARETPRQMGRYEIVCKLAVGGMAEIFLARRRAAHGFEKHVVIKRILAHYAADPRFVQMFLDEARLAAKLQHPNIGQVYDIGQHDDTYFFAMEYLHGADVREICRAAGANGTRVPLEHTLAAITGIAAGLDYAHERTDEDGEPLNLVHRDVSPSNIILTYDGVAKLVDFGIARATTRRHETHTGHLRGKLAYMSPEQCRRQRLDRRADIFALGVVLYELSTGQRLFRHGNESDYLVMTRIVHGEVPPPTAVTPGYPAQLEKIVLRALATDREQRYPTAGELLAELQAFARSEHLESTPADLSKYVRELTGDRAEPWRESFDPDQLDQTRDEVPYETRSGSTDNEVSAHATVAEPPTADIETRVLRAPLLIAPTAVEDPTLDRSTESRTLIHRRVSPSITRNHPRATAPVLVFAGAVLLLVVAALAIGDGNSTSKAAEAPAPRAAPVVEALATPVSEPLDAAPAARSADRRAPAPATRGDAPAPSASPPTAPAPTVTSLEPRPPETKSPTRSRIKRATKIRRKKPRARKRVSRSKARPKAKARPAKARAKPKRRPKPKSKPKPDPEEVREWDVDSPLLPSRAG